VVTGLTTNTAYSFEMKATNTGGDSVLTSAFTATTLTGAPTLTSSATSSTAIAGQLDGRRRRDGLQARTLDRWRQLDAGRHAPGGGRHYPDSSLSPDTEYFYRMRVTKRRR